VAASVAAACAMGPAARAATLVLDFTVSGNWFVPVKGFGNHPFGLPGDPVLTGQVTIDSTKTDSTAFQAIDYATGTRNWTLADIDATSTVTYNFDGSFNQFGIFFLDRNSANDLFSSDTASIFDGPADRSSGDWIACNNCVTINSITTIAGASAPEPASWAMMILGFGGLGALARRRRRLALAG
jgi:hypothetical protein